MPSFSLLIGATSDFSILGSMIGSGMDLSISGVVFSSSDWISSSAGMTEDSGTIVSGSGWIASSLAMTGTRSYPLEGGNHRSG